jgi:hypothetical protein
MAPYHLLPGFRVRVTKRPTHDHWQGGKARHAEAVCTTCDRPLLLLWDLNGKDPRFRVDGSQVFKWLDRLPLYYCWTCCAEMDYCVTAPNRIVILKNEGTYQGRDFPYKRFPLEFRRQPLQLDQLADMPQSLKKLIPYHWGEPVPTKVRKYFANWLGHRVKDGFDIWWHQLGGLPWLVQGPEEILCPNPRCPGSRHRWRMKILAVIRNDPPSGLPMIETMRQVKRVHGDFDHWNEVVFHICKKCLTIHVGSRCD